MGQTSRLRSGLPQPGRTCAMAWRQVGGNAEGGRGREGGEVGEGREGRRGEEGTGVWAHQVLAYLSA